MNKMKPGCVPGFFIYKKTETRRKKNITEQFFVLTVQKSAVTVHFFPLTAQKTGSLLNKKGNYRLNACLFSSSTV
ncbi:hypothetical protein [Fictibacillus sp. BK138]|uniref:hypothetical protein n=1 Tax=Fictibacillus sp. BK138 TaxID=2512121 RepID=UPI0010294BB8|nr:hypothetical protein [Fictibacillus sp. BK138]